MCVCVSFSDGAKGMQTLTFVEPVGQEIVSGPVLQGLLVVDGGQVLPPGVGVQSPEELLHRVEGRDGPVQVVHGEGAWGRRRRRLHAIVLHAIVLHGGRGAKMRQEVALCSLCQKSFEENTKHPIIGQRPPGASEAASARQLQCFKMIAVS